MHLLKSEPGVYCIRNKINGKKYIGSASRSVYGRIKDHKFRLKCGTHANSKLQRAWDKYGGSKFTFKALEYCTPNLCIQLEQKYINKFNSSGKMTGYNICPTAASRLGVKLSPEMCLRVSQIAKEAMSRPEVRAKLSAATKLAMKNPKLRARLSLAAKRRFADPEARKKASLVALECQARPEVKAKRRASLVGVMSAVVKKQWKKPGRKAKAYRPDWSDPEYRKKQSESIRLGIAKRKLLLQEKQQ